MYMEDVDLGDRLGQGRLAERLCAVGGGAAPQGPRHRARDPAQQPGGPSQKHLHLSRRPAFWTVARAAALGAAGIGWRCASRLMVRSARPADRRIGGRAVLRWTTSRCGRPGRRQGHPAAAVDARRRRSRCCRPPGCRSSPICCRGSPPRDRARDPGTSYKAAVFEAEFGDGSKLGLQIEYVTEEHPLGTGGGIANVAGKLRHDTVMVFNGDVLSGATWASCWNTTTSNTPISRCTWCGSATRGRLAACRPKTAVSQRFWRRPRIRRPTRSTPAATCSPARSSTGFPRGREVSVEREVFPALLSDGSQGLRLRRQQLLARHGHAGGLRARVGRPGARHRARRRRWAAIAASSWCTTVRRCRPARC